MVGLLAFFKRSLREHSRSDALVIARAALALTLLACLVFFNLWSGTFGAAGLQFFTAVIRVNALFITIGGGTYFAAAIAEEKDDGTLALLRISEARSFSILLGKGGARLLDGLLLLAVQIPFTLIGITLGGITWTQVLAAYADLGGYLVLVCNVGLLAGVLAHRTAQAIVFAASALAVLLFGGHFLELTVARTPLPVCVTENIFDRFGQITTTNFDGPILSPYLENCALLALAFFLLAWSLFDRFCSETAPFRPDPSPPSERLDLREPGRRAPEIDLIPMKDFYFLHGGFRAWTRKKRGYALLALLLGIDLVIWRSSFDLGELVTLWGLRLYAAGWIAMALEWLLVTSRMFRIELQEGTLAALLALPHHSAQSLIHAKSKVVLPVLRPAWTFTRIGFLILALGSAVSYREGIRDFIQLHVAMLMSIAIVIPQFLCLDRLVLHCSLRVRSGALPMALGIWLLGNTILGLLYLAMTRTSFLMAVIAAILGLALPAVFATLLGERNRRLITDLAATT